MQYSNGRRLYLAPWDKFPDMVMLVYRSNLILFAPDAPVFCLLLLALPNQDFYWLPQGPRCCCFHAEMWSAYGDTCLVKLPNVLVPH